MSKKTKKIKYYVKMKDNTSELIIAFKVKAFTQQEAIQLAKEEFPDFHVLSAELPEPLDPAVYDLFG